MINLMDITSKAKRYYQPASPKQIEFAKELGHPDPTGQTFASLSAWIDKALVARKEAAEAACDRANEVDLLSLAERHTTLTITGHTRIGPCPMPGCSANKDGFWVDTRTNTGGCHTCFWPMGVGSGPIGFIRALTGCEAWEARDMLVGDISVPVTPKRPIHKPEATKPTLELNKHSNRSNRDFTGLSRASTVGSALSGGAWIEARNVGTFQCRGASGLQTAGFYSQSVLSS